MPRYILTNTAIITTLCSAWLAPPVAADIPWRNSAQPAQAQALNPEPPQDALPRLAARPDASHVVIEMPEAATAAQRQALAQAGVILLDPLGGGAYFAALTADVNEQAALAAAPLQTVRAIDTAWKLHPLLANNQIPAYALIPTQPGQPEAAADPLVAVYAMFHDDVDIAAADQLIQGLGGIIRDHVFVLNTVVAEAPRSKIAELAAHDSLKWIEPALPQLSTMNFDNRIPTQVNSVQSFMGLTGQGVQVMVYDGGTMLASHEGFGDRVTIRDNDGLSDHATHVGGTIGGSGLGSDNLMHRGMAPGVLFDSFGFQWGSGGIFLYSNPGDIEADYGAAINVFGSDIANNSIGTNTASNGFPCEITGDYGVTAALIDTIVRGGLGSPFRIVWANGNERGSGNCGTSFYSTAPPATAKNHLTVGAINANDESMTDFSSWGPTDDGRLKPDVSAPGCQSNGDEGVTSTSGSGGYNTKCGTSMASPTVCGIGALILQDFRNQFPYRPDFRNSTLRALLAHTAADLGNPGPDYQFGYGGVRAFDAITAMRTGSFLEGAVGHDGSEATQIVVEPGDAELRVTIAWDDAPATPNIAVALVNQLDLVVTDPAGIQHFPWTLNPDDPGADATQDKANTLDNIEQVLVVDPQPGVWTVEVTGTNVPQGPQTFSMIATPQLTAMFLTVTSATEGLVTPGQPIPVDVAIEPIGQELVAGSAELFYIADGDVHSTPLTPVEGSLYSGTIPGPLCDEAVIFWVKAAGAVTGDKFAPPTAPAEGFAFDVGEIAVTVSDDMETDQGWVAGFPGDDADTGIWNRMDPQQTIAQPEDDHTVAGSDCWVTDGAAGNGAGAHDIDDGKTTLLSPVYDLSAVTNPTVSYWRWYSNAAGAAPNADIFIVDISNDNGLTWVNLETIGPGGAGTSGGWFFSEFDIDEVLQPTSLMRLRFIAADEDDGSLVEAAIDDLLIASIECDFIPPVVCPADLDSSGAIGSGDLNVLLGDFGASDAGDIDGDGDTDSDDLNLLLGNFGQVCD